QHGEPLEPCGWGAHAPHPRLPTIETFSVKSCRRERAPHATLRFENNHRIKPSAIRPTRPLAPRSLMNPTMFPDTLPKNETFWQPARRGTTMASASNIRPRSVNAPTHAFKV